MTILRLDNWPLKERKIKELASGEQTRGMRKREGQTDGRSQTKGERFGDAEEQLFHFWHGLL